MLKTHYIRLKSRLDFLSGARAAVLALRRIEPVAHGEAERTPVTPRQVVHLRALHVEQGFLFRTLQKVIAACLDAEGVFEERLAQADVEFLFFKYLKKQIFCISLFTNNTTMIYHAQYYLQHLERSKRLHFEIS